MEEGGLAFAILEAIDGTVCDRWRLSTVGIIRELGESAADVRMALERLERDGFVQHVRALSGEDPRTALWYWRLTDEGRRKLRGGAEFLSEPV